MSDESQVSWEKCGHTWVAAAVPEDHGWAAPTGAVVQEGDVGPDGNPRPEVEVGANVFTYVRCSAATPEQVTDYQAAKRFLADRKAEQTHGVQRTVAEGTEGHGKEQLEQ